MLRLFCLAISFHVNFGWDRNEVVISLCHAATISLTILSAAFDEDVAVTAGYGNHYTSKTSLSSCPKEFTDSCVRSSERAPLGTVPGSTQGWPRGPRMEYLAGLEQGEPRIQWIWPQPLREKEHSEWAASTSLARYTGNAASDRLSWLAVSRSVQFVGGKTLREVWLFEKQKRLFILILCIALVVPVAFWSFLMFFFFENSSCGFWWPCTTQCEQLALLVNMSVHLF